jgi:hypothetical protein
MALNSLLLAGAASAVAFSTPAFATKVIVTYSGTISSGHDQAGEFGAAGDSLAGMIFSAQYIFDTKRGATISDDEISNSYGGTRFGTSNPLVTASLTINGQTIYPEFSSGEIYNYNNGLESQQISHGVSYYDNEFSYKETVLYNNVWFDGDYYPNNFVTFTGSLVGNHEGYYQNSFYDYSQSSYVYDTFVILSATNLTITAVPEPTTWAMMVAGFGIIGFAARKRSAAKTSVTFA